MSAGDFNGHRNCAAHKIKQMRRDSKKKQNYCQNIHGLNTAKRVSFQHLALFPCLVCTDLGISYRNQQKCERVKEKKSAINQT